MYFLSFLQEGKEHQIPFDIGVTIREILDTTNLRAFVIGCSGNRGLRDVSGSHQ